MLATVCNVYIRLVLRVANRVNRKKKERIIIISKPHTFLRKVTNFHLSINSEWHPSFWGLKLEKVGQSKFIYVGT